MSIILITKRLCAKNNPRSRADDGVMMMPIIIFVIDPNAFLENEFYALFSNAIAKVYQFRRGTRCMCDWFNMSDRLLKNDGVL